MNRHWREPACTRCGAVLYNPADAVRIQILPRRWACGPSCVIDVVDDVAGLFAARVPGASLWHLGSDDIDGQDEADTLDALPHATVEIVHADGVLKTRPLPVEYAHRIASQASRLGFTAMLDEPERVATPDGPGFATSRSDKTVTVNLDEGRTRIYPANFVNPLEGGAR